MATFAALVAAMGASASPALAANNPGTGDTGFFTFPVSSPDKSVRVNVASGNLFVRAADLSDADATYHVTLDRFYSSLAPSTDGILGPRWAFHVDPKVQIIDQGATAVIAGPSGYRITATKSADGTYTLPSDFNGALTKTESGWTLQRTTEDDVFSFDGSGSLTGTTDSDGRRFTTQSTSAAGKTVLSSFGDQNGRRLNISYTGDAHVRQIDDPASGHHMYGFTNGRLTSKGGPGGGQGTYGYDAAGYLNRVEQPSGDIVTTVNDAQGRVTSFTVTPSGGSAKTTAFDYGVPGQTTVTNPDGSTQVYAYDDDWRVVGRGLRDGTVHVGDRLYRLADLNADDKADVAMVDRVSGNVAVALGRGDGSFAPEASWGTFGAAVSRLAVGDLNADGNSDFVVQAAAGTVKSLLSTGTATYAPDQGEDGALQASWPASRTFEMTQGGLDRTSDLWGVDPSTNQLYIAEGSELGPLDGEVRTTIPGARITLFADLNGDGDDDLVTYDPTDGTVRFHEYDNGDYGATQTWGTGPAGAQVTAGDVNGDGNDDVAFRVSAGTEPDRVLVRESSVEDGFLPGTRTLGSLASSYALQAQDVDGDGRDDAMGTRVQNGDLLLRSVASSLPNPEEPDTRAIDPDDDQTALARNLPTPPIVMGQSDTELLWRRNIGLSDAQALQSFSDTTLDALATASVEKQMRQMRHIGITRLRVFVYWGQVDRLHPDLRNQVTPVSEGSTDATVPGMDAVPGVTSNSAFADRSFATPRRVQNRWLFQPYRKLIAAANATGMKLHFTLTGGVAASFTECSRNLSDAIFAAKPRGCYGSGTANLNGQVPAFAAYDPSTYRPTGFNPDPDEFRTFVAETTRALRSAPGGTSIESLGLWNEPNLQTNGKGSPNSFLAITSRTGLRVDPKHTVPTSDGRGKVIPPTIETASGQAATRPLVNTAAAYGRLYAAGYQGIDDAGARADVLSAFGELSSGRTKFSEGKRTKTAYPGPWTKEALTAAKAAWKTRSLPGDVPIVDAFAVHPYQHTKAPWQEDKTFTFGVSGLSKVTSKNSKRIGVQQTLRQAAAADLVATKSATSGSRPPIWGTEFGYWSSQLGGPQQGSKVHSEAERLKWTRYAGSGKKGQPGALQLIFKTARARRLNFYGTFETPPNKLNSDPSEDYGYIGSGATRTLASNEFDYPASSLGDVDGRRPYEKSGGRLATAPAISPPTRRIACMLRTFVNDEGGTVTASPYTEPSKQCG